MTLPALVTAFRAEAFIEAARTEFVPSNRQSCCVCKGYISLTHAHHVVPLSIQFKSGWRRPDHKHVWLCPTHHAAVHIVIGETRYQHRRGGRSARVRSGFIDMVCELEASEWASVLKLAEQAFTYQPNEYTNMITHDKPAPARRMKMGAKSQLQVVHVDAMSYEELTAKAVEHDAFAKGHARHRDEIYRFRDSKFAAQAA